MYPQYVPTRSQSFPSCVSLPTTGMKRSQFSRLDMCCCWMIYLSRTFGRGEGGRSVTFYGVALTAECQCFAFKIFLHIIYCIE